MRGGTDEVPVNAREPRAERAVSLEPDVLRLGDDEHRDTLLGSRCRECGRYFFPQRVRCAACAEPTTDVVELSRDGIVASFTRLHRKPEFSLMDAPYVLAEVTLPEGLHVYSVLVMPADRDPVMGGPVRICSVRVKEDEEGRAVLAYAFAPIEGLDS